MVIKTDVVVIGGGPAGSATATLIAQAGHDVTLIEKDVFPRYKIGESLLPSTVGNMAEILGVISKFQQAGFQVKRGATFSWGKNPDRLWNFNFGGSASERLETVASTPFAYNVDRSKFDQILLENALDVGVEVHQGCAVTALDESDSRVKGVVFRDSEGNSHSIEASIVVDASGQKSSIAKKVGRRKLSQFFEKVAVWTYFEGAGRLNRPLDGNVLFQAIDDSWLWYVPMSNDLTSVGIVCPPNELPKDQQVLETFLLNKVEECSHVKALVSQGQRAKKPPYNSVRVCSEYSYCYTKFWKPGLALVGDSACFVDILLASGVHMALYGALLLSQSINTILTFGLAEEIALNEYEIRIRKEYARFYNGLLELFDSSLDETEYINRLRLLLFDTSGISIDDMESAAAKHTSQGSLRKESSHALDELRKYNSEQLLYNPMTPKKEPLPNIPCFLNASQSKRFWNMPNYQ